MLGSHIAPLPWQGCPTEKGTDGAHCKFNKDTLRPAEKGTDGARCKFNKGTLQPAKIQMARATLVAKQ